MKKMKGVRNKKKKIKCRRQIEKLLGSNKKFSLHENNFNSTSKAVRSDEKKQYSTSEAELYQTRRNLTRAVCVKGI